MSSNYYEISDILELIVLNEPRSICDVGAGFGKWGVLTRLYLENHPHKPTTWKTIIDAIEIFPSYLCNTHHFYNDIRVGDIKEEVVQGYDLVLLLHVLEHLPKKEATALIERLISHNKWVIISTPSKFKRQGALYGNPSEKHLSRFKQEEFHHWSLKTRIIHKKIIAFSMGMRTSPPLRKALPSTFRKWILKYWKPQKYSQIYNQEG